jgi:hypothetical protein
MACGIEVEVEEGAGVFLCGENVIRTFLAGRQMERVEYVTVHLPNIHWLGGGTNGDPVLVVGFDGSVRYLDGLRNWIPGGLWFLGDDMMGEYCLIF